MELDCGIKYARIRAWLDDELGLSRDGDAWVFAAEGGFCRVRISPLEKRRLGVVAIERTHLSAEGDKRALRAFDRLFTLRFISAGG